MALGDLKEKGFFSMGGKKCLKLEILKRDWYIVAYSVWSILGDSH